MGVYAHGRACTPTCGGSPLTCADARLRTRVDVLTSVFQTDGAGSIPVARSTNPAGQTSFRTYVLDRSGSSETPFGPCLGHGEPTASMPVGTGSPGQPQLDVRRAPDEPRDSPTDSILSAMVLGMSACSAHHPVAVLPRNL